MLLKMKKPRLRAKTSQAEEGPASNNLHLFLPTTRSHLNCLAPTLPVSPVYNPN